VKVRESFPYVTPEPDTGHSLDPGMTWSRSGAGVTYGKLSLTFTRKGFCLANWASLPHISGWQERAQTPRMDRLKMETCPRAGRSGDGKWPKNGEVVTP